MLQVFRDNTFFFFAMINSVKNKQTFQEERTNLCFFSYACDVCKQILLENLEVQQTTNMMSFTSFGFLA